MRIGWRTDDPPKEDDYYLVQYKGGGMDVAHWTYAARFINEETRWYWNGTAQYCKVIAWMPLPEDYVENRE